jgi:hypothetical protein
MHYETKVLVWGPITELKVCYRLVFGIYTVNFSLVAQLTPGRGSAARIGLPCLHGTLMLLSAIREP